MPTSNTCCVNAHSSHFHLQPQPLCTVHPFVSLLLRLITSPTAPTSTAQFVYHTLTFMMSSNLAPMTCPFSSFDASIPISTHFPMILDMRLWKRHLFYWNMVTKHILWAMVWSVYWR